MNTNENATPTPSGAGTGYLIVHVTTARGSIPLEGAQVLVRNYLPEEATDSGDIIATLTTNRDGNTDTLSLPTIPRQQSLTPTDPHPYTSYNVEIFLEGYNTQNNYNIPIFDGITAIQPADLIPLPENGRPDSRTPDGESFVESAASPRLNS